MDMVELVKYVPNVMVIVIASFTTFMSSVSLEF